MSVFHDTLFQDLFKLDCQVPQPLRLGVGFNYEEIRARCEEVTGQAGSSQPPAGHIFNVDQHKHVRFSPEDRQKRYFRRKRSRRQSVSDDSEILRTKMSRIRRNIPGRREGCSNTSQLNCQGPEWQTSHLQYQFSFEISNFFFRNSHLDWD